MVLRLSQLLMAALLGILTVSFVPFAEPVGATGTYSGETLTLALSGRAVQGEQTIFVAAGRQTDVPGYPGGFGLDVFAKDVSVSRTCSPSYLGEEQASTHSTYEQQIVFGLPQGTTKTFNARFVYTFPRTGQVVLCAYSTWVTDTAAAATLTINIVPASAPVSPAKVVAPKVAELDNLLICHRGTWKDAVSYAFAWSTNGSPDLADTDEIVAVSSLIKGKKAVCTVTAYNPAGSTTASSPPFLVH
jgi:hypothetical protein